jgi:hypothetical protein
MGIRLSDLSKMSDEERDRVLGELFQAALNPTPEQIAEQADRIMSELLEYERSHGMTSAEMKAGIRSGTVVETEKICSWLMLLHVVEEISDDFKLYIESKEEWAEVYQRLAKN